MERLRAAIEQARKTRNEEPSVKRENRTTDALQAPVEGDTKGRSRTRAIGDAGVAGSGAFANAEVAAHWANLQSVKLKPGRLRRQRLVGDQAKGQERAAFDMLRTRLLTQMQKENWRRVAVTSPAMACGKSTATLNLALSLSRMPEIKTIVFETDMRRPSMARMLGLRGEQSVFDVLSGKAEFSEQAVRIADNVAVSINHGVTRNPAEILHSPRAASLLKLIEEAYQPDVVIFDMPPMMQSDDALGFLKNVDCAILIALAESTTLEQVDFCETEIAAHTNVAGVVLNRCRFAGGGYGYGYGDY